MDFFGIGQGVIGSIRVYFQSARATGRTTNLVESVKHGDRVCFLNNQDLRHFQIKLKERGIKGVECIVLDIDTPEDIYSKQTSQCKTIFDHRWLEQYYLKELSLIQEYIQYLETNSSGYGEEHLKTKRKATEIAKWSNPF